VQQHIDALKAELARLESESASRDREYEVAHRELTDRFKPYEHQGSIWRLKQALKALEGT